MVNFKCLYPQKIWRSSLFLALCLFFSQVANAEDYYFQGEHHGDLKFKTADLACKYDGEKVAQMQNRPLVGTVVSFRSPGTYNCRVNMPDDFFRYTVIARRGDGCPDGGTFDEENGLCKEDPCMATVGQMTTHLHRLGDFSGAGVVNGRVDPPSKVCSNSCQYAWDFAGPTSAYRFVSGTPNGVFATFNYKGNGVSCTEGDTSVSAPGSKEATKEKDSKCTDKVEDAEGRVHYTCQASEVFKEPGSMSCGTVNGQTTCVAKKPSPKLDDKKVTTEVTEKVNSDGSKTTETKTTTTTTTCTGANSCNTTVTTSTSTSKTNADGSRGGDTSTCTGPGCSGSKPDGSETPDEEEEEEGGSAVSGDMACTAVPVCEGDAIQCAILRQTQQQRCGDEEFREVTDKKITDLKSSLAAEFSGEEYQPLKPSADGTFDMSSMVDTSSRFSKTCPVLPDIQYTWLDGSRQSLPLADALNNMCTVFTWLGYFVVAFAMRRGAEIVAGGLA